MQKILFFLFLLINNSIWAQTDFPVKEWNAKDTKNPFVFYISGDGGLNSFSTSLCESISSKGYRLTALNAKSYFWNKQTPERVAADINSFISAKRLKADDKIIFVGYSFGADVLPFIVNRLPEVLKKKIRSVILLSPSPTTDFEIHWSDMLGGNKKRSMDVADEINKLSVTKTTTIFGSDEKDFSPGKISLKSFTNKTLAGGHHFEGNTEEVAKMIISCF